MSRIAARFNEAWLTRGGIAAALWPVSLLMATLVCLRRLAYRRAWFASHRLPVPVIVVGNRVVGGAGKTPTTIAVIQHLQERGWRPGVLSRGYKAAPQAGGGTLLDSTTASQLTARETGDEPMLIWRRTGAPAMIGRDRVAGGHALLSAHPDIDVLVCDDGLQHLRLQRDIEIVVFDARGAGNGWLLPAGPLREPIAVPPPPGLKAAPIVLYNAPCASTALPGHLASTTMAPLRLLQDWWHGQPTREPLTPAGAHGPSLWAVAGIAHPDRFFEALRRQGFAPLRTVALADHADLTEPPWPNDAVDVIVTEKDAVKLDAARLAQTRPACRVWVAALDFRPEASFWRDLDDALQRLAGRSTSG